MRDQVGKLMLLFLLLILLPSWAAAEITVPEKSKRDTPIVATIQPTGVPAGAQIRGSITISKAEFIRLMKTDKDGKPTTPTNTFHIWAGPGTHIIRASGVWVLTKEITVDKQKIPVLVDFGQYDESKEFAVEGKQDPDPDPGPDPGPIPKSRWIAILEETGDRTVEQNQKIAALRKGLPTETLLTLDRNQQGASLASVISQVKSFPSFVVLDGDGNILYKGPLPTVAEAQQILGGKK